MEEIYFDKEGREKLINGINKLTRAVSSTMGPMGSTVIIPDSENYGGYKVTKDGVSVANSISFIDPLENIGAKFIREAAQKTLDEAGDGTTTATVLASAFVNNLKDFDILDINRAFDEIIPNVLLELKKSSKQLSRKDIKYVASISANNDTAIGELIQKAYDHTDTIKVEKSNNIEDKLELVEGMSLPVSYFSKHFITDKKKDECNLVNPHVIVIDGKLENLKPFETAIKLIAEKDEELLIITEHIHDQFLRILETNVINGYIKACVIKAPGFAKHRQDLLRDIADFTGATIINETNRNTSLGTGYLGRLQSCKITKNNSLLVKDPNINIDEFISNLKELSKSDELTTYDKELVNQRIEKLEGKISIIKVGGKTESEMKERYDRYDDAIKAVACALEEGVVEGGGVALIKAGNNIIKYCNNLDYHITLYINDISEKPKIEEAIRNSFYSPMLKMIDNGAEINMKNHFEKNIIDPLKVTRCALENAVSVAKTILSTKAVVLSQEEYGIRRTL